MIPVTKPYLPNREKLDSYIDGIYERNWLTNNGPLVQELTSRLEEYLDVENLLLVSNGTLALQIAYRVLGITTKDKSGKIPEAITTPFTFVATASSLKWEGVDPVFVDIDPDTWCLNPENIEAAITERTKAIVPVHVFGNACDVETIENIAGKNNLKVIYDAAHAFGVKYKNESLLKWGDASTLSFHATKLFHTVEGGAIIFKRKEDLEKAKKMISFGLAGPDSIDDLGINAKMNELQAAMGLCVLDEIETIAEARKNAWGNYQEGLPADVTYQVRQLESTNNYAYAPVLFPSESKVESVLAHLNESEIYPRRYFYPSLEQTKLFGEQSCPVSHDISKRILCLPLYSEVDSTEVVTAMRGNI